MLTAKFKYTNKALFTQNLKSQFLCKIVVALIFIHLPTKFKAQFNDSTFYYAGISSTGTYNQTKLNRTFLVNSALRLGVKKKAVASNASFRYMYGMQGDAIVNNDITSSWDLNLYKTLPRFNYWALCVYNKIFSLRVNNQLQSGLGVAYNIIERESLQLNLSNGIIYDYNDVQLSDTLRDIYGTLRNSFRFQFRYSKKNLTFRNTFFLQNSFEYKNDYIVRADATLSLRVLKVLSLTVQGNYNQMTRTKRETLFITYGLTFEKFF